MAPGVLWDAITDPLMGRISDRTRARAGRRRPYVAIGAVALAGAIVVLFSPPDVTSQGGKFTVLLLSYILANTAMTVIAVPYAALAGDLSGDSNVRARLFGWRLVFANAGLVLGTALPGLLAVADDGPGAPERDAAVIVAGITVVVALLTFRVTRGLDVPPAPGTRQQPGYLRSLDQVARNRCFWPLLIGYLVANIGLNINAATALYYYEYRLALEAPDTRLIITVFMLVFCLSIPAWVIAARRFGTRRPVIAGALTLGIMNCVVYLAFPVGNPWWPLVASVLGGLPIGCVVLLEVMLADVVDHDRVHHREARFGLYFGVWKMAAKMSRALAIALTGNVLAWIGFEPNTVQDADTSLAIAMLFGPGVGVFFIVAAAVIALHPIELDVRRRVQRILARRDARGGTATSL